MKRVRLLVLTLMAMFALGAVVAASASATEAGLLYLPGEAGEVTFSGEGGEGELVGLPSNTKIKCLKTSLLGGKYTGTEKHVKEGTISEIHITGCKQTKGETKVACNTEGDEKEVILLPKNTPFAQFNALDASKALSAGIALTTAEFSIICGAVSKVKLKGTALGTVVAGTLVDLTEATLKFAGNVAITCDEVEGLPFCKEKKEKANELLVNFAGTFETADLLTSIVIKLNKMMLLDN